MLNALEIPADLCFKKVKDVDYRRHNSLQMNAMILISNKSHIIYTNIREVATKTLEQEQDRSLFCTTSTCFGVKSFPTMPELQGDLSRETY